MIDGLVVAVAPLPPEHHPVDIQTDADPGVGTSEHIVGLRLRMVESYINNLDLQAHNYIVGTY